jgi:hypothetical protein
VNATEQLASELEGWWTKLAQADMEIAVPKAVEYSSTDLDLVGRWMAGLLGIKLPDEPGIEIELACMFYLFGKMARALGAYRDGRRPSDDTIRDARIYLTMLTRARETGGWPGTEAKAKNPLWTAGQKRDEDWE